MNSKSKLERLKAYHEAGHAVMARTLGMAMSYVTMLPTDDMTAGSAMADSASWLARNADQATQLAAIEKDMKALLAGPHAQARYQPRKTKRIPSEWASDFKLAKSCATKAVLIRNGRGADVPIGEGTFEIALGVDDLAEIDQLQSRLERDRGPCCQTVASNHAGCRGVIDSPLAFRGRSGCVDKGGD